MKIKYFGINNKDFSTAEVLKGVEYLNGMLLSAYQDSISMSVLGITNQEYIKTYFGDNNTFDRLPLWDIVRKSNNTNEIQTFFYFLITNGYLKQTILDDTFFKSIYDKSFVVFDDKNKDTREYVYSDCRPEVDMYQMVDLKILGLFFAILLQYIDKEVRDIYWFMNEKDNAKKKLIAKDFSELQKFMIGIRD